MSGLDEILNKIESQQKENEDRMISAAESKAAAILKDAEAKAEKAYQESVAKAESKHQQNYINSCNSVDAANKRRLLACRIELISNAIENVLAKLRGLPDAEYFDMLERLITDRIREGKGVLELSAADLKRLPADFEEKLGKAASGKNGSIEISKEPANISDGFILTYGLVSENCSFEAILESEKDGIRDIAARELFGQVS